MTTLYMKIVESLRIDESYLNVVSGQYLINFHLLDQRRDTHGRIGKQIHNYRHTVTIRGNK